MEKKINFYRCDDNKSDIERVVNDSLPMKTIFTNDEDKVAEILPVKGDLVEISNKRYKVIKRKFVYFDEKFDCNVDVIIIFCKKI